MKKEVSYEIDGKEAINEHDCSTNLDRASTIWILWTADFLSITSAFCGGGFPIKIERFPEQETLFEVMHKVRDGRSDLCRGSRGRTSNRFPL